MDEPRQRLRCNWAGCPQEFDDENGWIQHAYLHVFTLKPGKRTPWLGPPEENPDLERVLPVDGAFLHMIAEQKQLIPFSQKIGQTVTTTTATKPFPKQTPHTGEKTQFSNLVHCRDIVRTWTMYLPNTRPVHYRYIQNFPSQLPGSFPGAANAQYIHSVPGCVIKMS